MCSGPFGEGNVCQAIARHHPNLRALSLLKARVAHSNSDFSLLSCSLASYSIHFWFN